MKIVNLVLEFMLLDLPLFAQNNYIPPQGYVPNQETAKKIAEAIWLPICGKSVLNEKPYKTELIGDSVWIATGSLPGKSFISGDTVSITVGGVARIEIRKKITKS
jgi:hypothetical protein